MRLDDVAQARAQVTQLENSMREIAVRQNDTRLLAPMSGVVTRRYVEEGELITSGVSAFSSGQAVLQIADLSRMRVTMSVNEVDVQRLRRGQAAEIVIDGAPRGVRFAGHVRKVAPASQNAGGDAASARAAAAGGGGTSGGVIRFAVEVLLDRPDERLRPGMSARCTVLIAQRKNVLRLPAACVKGDGKNAAVEVQETSGATTAQNEKGPRFTKRQVTVGLRGDSHVEIVSGLKEGDQVKQTPFTGPPRKGFNLSLGRD
jgi:HlyD family secretion protein